MKAHDAIKVLDRLDKQGVSAEWVKWCISMIGNRYPDWWERKRRRELITATPSRPEHHRARWQLVQLVRSDLELRISAEIDLPESLAKGAVGRHQHTCIVCGAKFTSTRSDKRTCSTRCRMQLSRTQKRTLLHLIRTDDPKHLSPK